MLHLIRCPFTRESLRECPADIIEIIQSELNGGQLFDQIGNQVETPFERALVNESLTYLAIIESGIPNLVPDQMIPIDHLELPNPNTARKRD